MNRVNRQIEEREQERVRIKSRGDAMLFGPDFAKGVQVIDLSRTGLAFRYVAGCEKLAEPLEIDILWSHMGLFLLKLKVRIVSDFHIANEYLLGVIPIRRCSAEFIDLTQDQISKLDYFIKNHSMDAVEAEHPGAVNQVIRFDKGEEPWKAI